MIDTLIFKTFETLYMILKYFRFNIIGLLHIFCRYQSGDQTPASEVGGPTTGGAMAPPGDLDVKTQILQQQELQKQASAAAKTKGNSAPTSPMKDGKRVKRGNRGEIEIGVKNINGCKFLLQGFRRFMNINLGGKSTK